MNNVPLSGAALFNLYPTRMLCAYHHIHTKTIGCQVCQCLDGQAGAVVGIAMLLLIFLSNLSHSKFTLGDPTERGIGFWSAMYIPIVVAMAAKQNVIAAISSGWMAIVAGLAAVVVSFAMIPVLSKIGNGSRNDS